MKISQALKTIRKAKKLKQVYVCLKAGISQTYISQIESGKKVPSLMVLQKIAMAYELPLPVLLWFSLSDEDIPENKKRLCRDLKPTIDQIIKGIFLIDAQ